MGRSPGIISAIIIMVGFIGCASLSKNECLQADWYELGYRDGSLGRSRTIFQEHYEACIDRFPKSYTLQIASIHDS